LLNSKVNEQMDQHSDHYPSEMRKKDMNICHIRCTGIACCGVFF